MNGPYKSAAELLLSIGCGTPAIRQGFGGLTLGRFNPLVPVNPHTRVGWEQRYGLPWGSRGDHSSGAAVFAEYAARADNPLNLTPFPYTVTDQDRSDANLLGTRSGEASWSVLRKRFGTATDGGSDDGGGGEEECPPGWNCEPMTAEMIAGCRDGTLFCKEIRGLKPGDKRRWRRESSLTHDKRVWISYNPHNSDPFKDAPVDPPVNPPVKPPVEPPVKPPVEPPKPPEPPTPPTLATTLELRLTDGGSVEVRVDEFGLMRVTSVRKISAIFTDDRQR